MKAGEGKSLEPSRVEKEKGKCNDHAAEMVFKNKHLRIFNKCQPLQKRPPEEAVLSLADGSTPQNIVGNCVWIVGCILLNIVLEGEPLFFF